MPHALLQMVGVSPCRHKARGVGVTRRMRTAAHTCDVGNAPEFFKQLLNATPGQRPTFTLIDKKRGGALYTCAKAAQVAPDKFTAVLIKWYLAPHAPLAEYFDMRVLHLRVGTLDGESAQFMHADARSYEHREDSAVA